MKVNLQGVTIDLSGTGTEKVLCVTNAKERWTLYVDVSSEMFYEGMTEEEFAYQAGLIVNAITIKK